MRGTRLAPGVSSKLYDGVVIPALPLALTNERKFDQQRQRALCRYYLAAGAGGLAVGVHSTQFEIREPKVGLYKPILELAMEEIVNSAKQDEFIKIAGAIGPTGQAVKEAKLAAELGYDLVLLGMGGLDELSETEHLARVREVGQILPVFGFYLQPQVGGRIFSYDFWKLFAKIPAVKAIKIAPFNRYFSLDVIRAVCFSGRQEEIALYTGNDDNIVLDLLTNYTFKVNGTKITKQIVGGLLGHWGVWTKRAVEILELIKEERNQKTISAELLQLNVEITDMNAALFDPANKFAGCIPGIHEVLRRQGLLANINCLNPLEVLSEGQLEEIDRVYRQYPHLTDDEFVRENLVDWLT